MGLRKTQPVPDTRQFFWESVQGSAVSSGPEKTRVTKVLFLTRWEIFLSAGLVVALFCSEHSPPSKIILTDGET